MLSSRERVRWGQNSSEQQRWGWGQQEDGEGCENLRKCGEGNLSQDSGREKGSRTWKGHGRQRSRVTLPKPGRSGPRLPFHLPPCLEQTCLFFFFLEAFTPEEKKTVLWNSFPLVWWNAQSPLQRIKHTTHKQPWLLQKPRSWHTAAASHQCHWSCPSGQKILPLS